MHLTAHAGAIWLHLQTVGPPRRHSGKESRDVAWTPGSRRCPGVGNGNPIQYSCLENPMDRGETSGLQSMKPQKVGHD